MVQSLVVVASEGVQVLARQRVLLKVVQLRVKRPKQWPNLPARVIPACER